MCKRAWSHSKNSVAFSPLIVSYTVEILPFDIRAKGFTVFNFAISLSLIFNQYTNPIALGMTDWFILALDFLLIVSPQMLSAGSTTSSTCVGWPLSLSSVTCVSSIPA